VKETLQRAYREEISEAGKVQLEIIVEKKAEERQI
jgi:hypothetical protein